MFERLRRRRFKEGILRLRAEGGGRGGWEALSLAHQVVSSSREAAALARVSRQGRRI